MAAIAPATEHRCRIFTIEWEPCGHAHKLGFVSSDCNYPYTLDHSNHPKVYVKVDAFTPCHFCNALKTIPELKARLETLEDVLQQKITEAGIQQPDAAYTTGLTTPSEQLALADTREALQRRISNLEGLLAGGFGVSRTLTNMNPNASSGSGSCSGPGSGSGSGSGPGSGPGSSANLVTPTTTVSAPAPKMTMPPPSPYSPTSSMSHPMHYPFSPSFPRPHVLRGQTGIRREFFPGVNWEENRLSRKQTAKHRDWLRRMYPTGFPVKN